MIRGDGGGRVLKANQALDVLWLVSEQIARLLDDDAIVSVARNVGIQSLALHHALLEDSRLHRLRAASLVPSAFAVYEDAEIETALTQAMPVFTTDRSDAALRIREALIGM